MGACLLTDDQVDLDRYFEPGREVVTYENGSDCAEKAAYLLDHPSERESIAAAGQLRTLHDHTYEIRARQLDAWLNDLLSNRQYGST